MTRPRQLVCLLLTVLLFAPWTAPPAAAEDGTCIHFDISVTADGELLTKGPQIAHDGGFGHAGTGQTFTFRARTYSPSLDICALKVTDRRTWQVTVWPCTNHPKPKPARTQSLSWSVTVPLDCRVSSSPGLLLADLTNGRGSAPGHVLIYAGAPGFALPDKQARGLFGPFALQSDPVNSLTGALTAVETDAVVAGPGVPLAVARTYNSNDDAPGALGRGWRAAYSDRLAITSTTATYHASDGREIVFNRRGSGFAIEQGAARFTLRRDGAGYVLTDLDGLRMRFTETGDLSSVLDRNGQGVRIRRDSGRVAAVTNGRRSLTYVYNVHGLVSEVTLAAPGVEPRTVRYEYAADRLTGVTSPGGLRTRYGYDSSGRLATETRGDASKPAVTTEYDGQGRVVSQVDGKGAKTTWTWQPAGIRGVSTMTDPAGGKWINEYERNWLVRQVDPTGSAVTFHYDASGNLIRVFDALGHGARHTYDSLGRVVRSTDAAGFTTRRTYNGSNDLTSITDPLGRRTTFSYDARGNLVRSTSAGRASSSTYDARGQLTSVRDPLGRTTRFTYSADGDLVAVTDPAGRVSKYEVDGWGRPVKAIGPRGETSTVTYSADDQPLEQRGPLDVAGRLSYDDHGRLATVTDPRGGVTRFRYDDAGQLVGVTAPSLPEATTEFDAAGRPTKQTDAGGRTQTFQYDGAGRTTAVTDGDRIWRFTYDKAGRLIRTTLPSGKSASFTLDARGAMTRIDYSDKTPSASFTWDAAGRRTTMTDVSGVTRLGYDAADRLTSVSRPGSVVSYRWDAVGNLLSRSASGHTESYSWDSVNRLLSASVDGKRAVTYSYDLARGSITAQRANGLAETRVVDVRGRETELRITRAGKPVRTITSAYDAADNLIRTEDSGAGKAVYTYDALNQVTAVCYAVDECTDDTKDFVRYGYDGSGNRTWEQRASGATWSIHGRSNELVASITTPAAYPRVPPTARFYTYDADGNLTNDGRTSYTWTAAGKPATSTAGSITTTYTHSADGRRLTSTTNKQSTRYLWDPISPQILTATTPQSTTRYTYAAGPLTQTTTTAKTAATADLIPSSTGSVLTAANQHHVYDPFGTLRPPTPTTPSTSPTPSAPSLGYAGGLQLPNGNYLFGQREYNPAAGTFLSPDQGPGTHPYTYASNNPLTRTDLTGLSDINDTLTNVSNLSGWTSAAALTAAVACTIYRPCAPAVPVLLQISSATGVASGIAAGTLTAEACILKGNCSNLAASVTLAAATSRLRVGTTGGQLATKTAARVCSFAGATTVLMADGTKKRIEDVEVGDKVVATDPETGEQVAKTVEHIFVHEDTVMDLVVDGDVIATTEDHPFWSVTDQRFERADELAVGEQVLSADGTLLTVSGLEAGSKRKALAYNLSVEGIHTYHVGQESVLVHNECSDEAWDIAMKAFDKHGASMGFRSVDEMGDYIDSVMRGSRGTLRDDGSRFWVDYANSTIIFRGPNAGVPGSVYRPDNFTKAVDDAMRRSVQEP